MNRATQDVSDLQSGHSGNLRIRKIARALVAHTDPEIRQTLCSSLLKNGYRVLSCESVAEILRITATTPQDFVLIDHNLQDEGTEEVIRKLGLLEEVPVLVLSGHASGSQKAELLDLGARDVLSTPFSMNELLARIRAALRRKTNARLASVFKIHDLEFDLAIRRVTFRGKEIVFTPTEFAILRVLALHPGQLLTHEEILQRVWSMHDHKSLASLRVHIKQIRRKLEQDGKGSVLIATEPGVGYRFCG